MNYSDWLEETPSALYGGYTRQGTQPWQNYWANRYGGVRQGYMGQLAGQIQGGGNPTLSWANYLKNYPFKKEWYSQSPRARGERPYAYSPRLRWLTY